MTYIQVQAAFFAKATGLPKQALVNDLTAHVLQLKGQLDAYAAGNYAQAYTLTNAAYAHMGMTARPAGRRDRQAEGPRFDHQPEGRICRSHSTGCSASTRCSRRGRRRPA